MDLASRRYVSLLKQLAAERGGRYGWKSEIARLLKVHPSYISQLVSGERQSVGKRAIERAEKGLGLSPRFFTVEASEELDYREFTAVGEALSEPAGTMMLNMASKMRLEEVGEAWAQISGQAHEVWAQSVPSADAVNQLAQAVLDHPMVQLATFIRSQKLSRDDGTIFLLVLGHGLARQIIATTQLADRNTKKD